MARRTGAQCNSAFPLPEHRQNWRHQQLTPRSGHWWRAHVASFHHHHFHASRGRFPHHPIQTLRVTWLPELPVFFISGLDRASSLPSRCISNLSRSSDHRETRAVLLRLPSRGKRRGQERQRQGKAWPTSARHLGASLPPAHFKKSSSPAGFRKEHIFCLRLAVTKAHPVHVRDAVRDVAVKRPDCHCP